MAPKKSKKPSRNGYWQFVMECRDKNPNRHMNQSELQSYASRKWAMMTKVEREPYETMAQLARDSYQPGRLTSSGLEVEELERQEKESAAKIQDMKHDITRAFKNASISMALDKHTFLIIHINHLTHYSNENRYFICEVAIAAASLRDGIKEVYHSLVKPGKLPLGLRGPAVAHSNETHQLINVVLDDDEEDNTAYVYQQIKHFMRKYGSNNSYPVLYVDEKTFEMTNRVFDLFRQDFGSNEEIKIYNLQYMFFALRNASAGQPVWPSESFGYSELDKDLYVYAPNIACEFHNMNDLPQYCSKSIVTRYAYTICDHCCADLGIDLVPGSHVPNFAKVSESRTSSRVPSVCSADGFQPVTRGRQNSASSTYESNYPALGASTTRSSSSIISFSSLKTVRNTPSTASRLERSFKVLALSEPKNDGKDLNLPGRSGSRGNN